MYTKSWQIIKDDTKKTYEIIGQTDNDNHFTNGTYAMQKAGMNVSCLTPPVTNQAANKEAIKITGYTKEEGLHRRLLKEFAELSRGVDDSW